MAQKDTFNPSKALNLTSIMVSLTDRFAFHATQKAESDIEIALSYVKTFKKQIATLLLQWYNKPVILWENRRKAQCGQAASVGIPVGCVRTTKVKAALHPIGSCSTALRKCEEDIIV